MDSFWSSSVYATCQEGEYINWLQVLDGSKGYILAARCDNS